MDENYDENFQTFNVEEFITNKYFDNEKFKIVYYVDVSKLLVRKP